MKDIMFYLETITVSLTLNWPAVFYTSYFNPWHSAGRGRHREQKIPPCGGIMGCIYIHIYILYGDTRCFKSKVMFQATEFCFTIAIKLN